MIKIVNKSGAVHKYVIEIHLGMKPVIGGMPLNERRRSEIRSGNSGEVERLRAAYEAVAEFIERKVRNRGRTINEYNRKYKILMLGCLRYLRASIHPK